MHKFVFSAFAAAALTTSTGQTLAQANPVLGKTIVCGKFRATFAQNGDVKFNAPFEGKHHGGKLKIVQNPGYKNIKNLEVIDAQGKFILHIQQESNGRYEMEGDRCTVAK